MSNRPLPFTSARGELLAPFAESQRLPLFFVEDRGGGRALVEEEVHVVGRIRALAHQQVGFSVAIPVVHERGENIAPAAQRIFHRRDDRFGDGFRLGKDRGSGRAAVANDEEISEIIAGHQVQLPAAREIGQGRAHAQAPVGPAPIPL
jgi:hypothetical protein